MLRAIIPPALFALAVTCGGEDGQQVTPRCTDANPCALGGGGGGGVTPDGNSGRGGSSAGSGTGGGTNGAGGGGTTSDASAGSESGGTAGAGSGGGGTAGAGQLCGNGGPDPGEECDTGSASETCDADCTLAVCGDRTVNSHAHEECDEGGATAACDADCSYVVCGDGTVHAEAGERCDTSGETAACDVDCTVPECGDGITNAAAGEDCDDANRAGGDGCSVSCDFERANSGGDTCADAIPVTLGDNQVTHNASAKNYFSSRPTCSQGEPSGPDVVLSYAATFTGTLEVTFAKPDARPWVAVMNQGMCGDTSAPVACIAAADTSMVERVPVVAGRTYYFYVAKAGTNVTPLANPFTLTLARLPAETGESCGDPIPVTVGENNVNWTASRLDHFYRTPACTNGAAIAGPDVVLSYTAAFDGYLRFTVEKPDATRWVAMVTGSPLCGDLTSPLGCISSHSGTSLTGLTNVTRSFSQSSAARYRNFLIANTSLGSNPLANPLKITLTGMDAEGGTGETCATSAKRITLGSNVVLWTGTVNDHLTSPPSCAGGHAVRGPDVVFEYGAPVSGTLSVTINKPAATRWVAVVGDYACGNVASPLSCLSDYSNTIMKGSLPVTGGFKYLLYLAATEHGTIPLSAPLTITLSQ